jgi:hypothetical protein
LPLVRVVFLVGGKLERRRAFQQRLEAPGQTASKTFAPTASAGPSELLLPPISLVVCRGGPKLGSEKKKQLSLVVLLKSKIRQRSTVRFCEPLGLRSTLLQSTMPATTKVRAFSAAAAPKGGLDVATECAPASASAWSSAPCGGAGTAARSPRPRGARENALK